MISSYFTLIGGRRYGSGRFLRGWSKSKEGGGPEENGGWVSKFQALQRGGSSHFSASDGGVGHDSS